MTSLKAAATALDTPSAHPKYRPDIDGLRAIAAGSVIIFHAFPSTMKGGFIGVDIFFVISGFLISQILFTNLDNNRFSLVDFYSRRINRIYPALIIVLVSCLAFGWFSLLSEEFKQLGKHTAGGAGFVANLISWSESGYFDNTSESKPLLHLWSLGVEEQFYIVWPLLLWGMWKSNFNRMTTILLITAVSFYLNISLRITDSATAFYSPLTRFWELLIGSLLAYNSMYGRERMFLFKSLANRILSKVYYHNPKTHATTSFDNTQALLGIVMIGTGFMVITKENMFPGFWAILPTVGSALFINAGPQAWFNKHILSNRTMILIGLISFPLYLWHWPLLSFARIIEGDTPAIAVRVIAILAAVILSWLTYQLIEKPVRFKITGRWKTLTLFLIMALIGVAGFSIFKDDGVPSRSIMTSLVQKSNELNTYQLTGCKNDELLGQDMSWCNKVNDSQPADVILWGDSHAEHLFPGIKRVSAQNWLLIGRHSCPPILGAKAWLTNTSKESCERANSKAMEMILQSDVKTVVLASLGSLYIGSKGIAPEHALINDNNPNNRYIIGEDNDVTHKRELFAAAMKRSISTLLDAGKNVIIVKDTPEFLVDPRACLARPFKISTQNCDIQTSQFEERSTEYNAMLAEIKAMSPYVKIFDPSSLFCNKSNCTQSDSVHEYFRDGHHLSEAGSEKVASALIEFMKNQ